MHSYTFVKFGFTFYFWPVSELLSMSCQMVEVLLARGALEYTLYF